MQDERLKALGLDEKDLLYYLVETSKINLDTTLTEIEDMEKKTILEQHPYAISHNQTEKGDYYYTYLIDPDRPDKRIYRRRNTLTELEEVIIQHYRSLEEVITFDTVWHRYIDEKLECGALQKASYDRYNNDFKRFFVDRTHNLTGKRFSKITEGDLERFIKMTIYELALTRKAYSGLRTIIRGTFKYGKSNRLTDISITHFFGDLEISRNAFTRKVVDKEKEVFMEEEIKAVTGYLRDHPTLYNLAILLAFETGLRVGELSALKYTDIKDGFIRIRRTENKYRAENGKWVITIKEHTKSDAGARDLIIPDSAKKTLKKIKQINPEGEYLFQTEKGDRIRSHALNKHLHVVCKELGIPSRSMHKIRKTYGTTLIDSNVDESFVMEQMGHADISTTKKYYYFSNKSEKKKLKQINKAISF